MDTPADLFYSDSLPAQGTQNQPISRRSSLFFPKEKVILGRPKAFQGSFRRPKAALIYISGPSGHHRSLGGLWPPKNSFFLTEKEKQFVDFRHLGEAHMCYHHSQITLTDNYNNVVNVGSRLSCVRGESHSWHDIA